MGGWPMRSARAAAVAPGSSPPGSVCPSSVSVYLQENGRLPSFFGMFDMYGGPWSASTFDDTFSQLLYAFLAVQLVVAWSGWLLWRGERHGAVLNLLTLPAEAVFWYGFALPLPWIGGAVRFLLVAGAWRGLGDRRAATRPESI
jgi:hypothetical protein